MLMISSLCFNRDVEFSNLRFMIHTKDDVHLFYLVLDLRICEKRQSSGSEPKSCIFVAFQVQNLL